MIDTVLFDIGGTLITQTRDPERAILDAQYIIHRLSECRIELDVDAKTLAQEIHTSSEEYKHLGERTLKELSPYTIWNEHLLKDRLGGRTIPDDIAEEFSFCHDFLRLDNRPREGLLETLTELKSMGMKIGIITNTISKTFADHILKQCGVYDFFPVIVKSCEFGFRKPDRRIFEHTMSLIGTTKDKTCYVGDTISRDVLGSRNADLAMCIRILNPSVAHRDQAFKDENAPKADFDIEKLIQIPAIIRDFNCRTRRNHD
ncbi:MAG: HAD family hydrolase [Spirochaetales bacterium]|nr:HAD family hydrolase [Spirochaetales bacterium]